MTFSTGSRSPSNNAWMSEPRVRGARPSRPFFLLGCGMNFSQESEWNICRVQAIRTCQATAMAAALVLLCACGEATFENAGSPHSLLEDREACAVEINNSSAATAYRQNPTAHPDYVGQVYEVMNRCIEGKGWKQALSPQAQERLKGAIPSELTHARSPMSITESEQPEDSNF